MNLSRLFLESRVEKTSAWLKGLWVMLILLLAGILTTGVMGGSAGVSQGGWASVWKYRDVFWQGWLLTILISLLSLAASSLIGLSTALARRSRILPLRSASLLYVEVVRGTPLLAQILFLFYHPHHHRQE